MFYLPVFELAFNIFFKLGLIKLVAINLIFIGFVALIDFVQPHVLIIALASFRMFNRRDAGSLRTLGLFLILVQ